MNFMGPKVTAEAVTAATSKKTFTAVPKGEYDMTIAKAVVGVGRDSGKSYMKLTLSHVGELAATSKYADALFADDEKGIGIEQFSGLLAAIGRTSDEIVGATWTSAPDATPDEKGNLEGAAILANGELVNLVGLDVRVYLSNKTRTFINKSGNEQSIEENRVSRFIAN